MATKAEHRIVRTRYYFLASATVVVLAVLLVIRGGDSAARVVLEALGTVAMTLFAASWFLEKWLWKTRLGRLLGFPPNYSGVWAGVVERTTLEGTQSVEVIDIQVKIEQTASNIEWFQKGLDSAGRENSTSRFVIGEVIDHLRPWSGIVGIYEVRYNNEVDHHHHGMQLVDVSEDLERIEGFYCSSKGTRGNIRLERKGS